MQKLVEFGNHKILQMEDLCLTISVVLMLPFK